VSGDGEWLERVVVDDGERRRAGGRVVMARRHALRRRRCRELMVAAGEEERRRVGPELRDRHGRRKEEGEVARNVRRRGRERWMLCLWPGSGDKGWVYRPGRPGLQRLKW
jgi:hypothetical protein